MIRQVTPGEITAIKVGVAVAYIIVLVFSIWAIESTVCGISAIKDRIAAFFAIFAVASVVPWLYSLLIQRDLRRSARRSELEKAQQDSTLSGLTQHLEILQTSLRQSPHDIDEISVLLQQLRRQIHILATSQERALARHRVVRVLNNKRFSRFKIARIVEEATEIGLQSFDVFLELPPKKQRKYKRGFRGNIFECIRWLSTSLEYGVKQDIQRLKKVFVIKTTVRPYVLALEHLKNDMVRSLLLEDDLEVEEFFKYIDLLIDGL